MSKEESNWCHGIMRISRKDSSGQVINLLKSKDYFGLKKKLTANFDINKRYGKGWTLLHYAADKDDPKLIKIIAGHTKVDLNLKASVSLWTPLIVAARFGKTRALKCLLEEGADASYGGRNGQTALMIASKANQVDCVKILLEFDSNLAKVQDRIGMNALMHAIENPSVMNELILHSDLEQVDKYRKTALHMASRSNLDAVKLIIAKNVVYLDAKDGNCETPLDYAINMEKLDIVCCLLENGVYFNAARGTNIYDLVIDKVKKEKVLTDGIFDKVFRTKFFKLLLIFNHINSLIAYPDGNFEKLIELKNILDKIIIGILNSKDNREFCTNELDECIRTTQFSSDSPSFVCNWEFFKITLEYLSRASPSDELKMHLNKLLNLAIRQSKIQICKYLLENGAYPSISLNFAADSRELVKLLIKHGADVNYIDDHTKFSPLRFAIHTNNMDYAKILLRNGADPYKYAHFLGNPIMNAIENNRAEILREILYVCRDFKYYRLESEWYNGMTIFLYACRLGYSDMIKIFLENNACLDDVDNKNRNCLHQIVLKRDLELVSILADALGNKFIQMFLAKDIYGTAPLDILLQEQFPFTLKTFVAAYPELKNYIKVPITIITNQDKEMCLICRDDFFEGEEATKLPCKHLFHEDCVKEWLRIQKSCPYCHVKFTKP